MSVSDAAGMTKPKLTIGNKDGGGNAARGKMRMFRMGQRLLSSYEYDTLDIAQIGGTGGNKHIVVDEIERFFDRGGKGKPGATVTDPRMTTGAVVFIPMHRDDEMPLRYYSRSYANDMIDKIEGGYRSWGAQSVEQETTGLSFKLTQLDSDRPAYFDNSHFWVSNILWEFSPDGGRGKWYQLYELPNQRVRVTLPEQTQQVRLRAISNNPEEWVQSIAFTPRTDFQNYYIENLHWYLPNGGEPEDYIQFDDFNYLTWPEAHGGRGDVIYTIYWTPEEEMSSAVLMGRTKRNDLAPEDYELPAQYLGGYLHVFAQDIMTTLHIKMHFTKSIADCEVLCDPPTSVYTGYAIEPSVTVRFKLDLSVLPPEDYSVEFQDNVNVGEATVIVTGLGYYEGTPEEPGRFQITPADVNSCAVIFDQDEYEYDGTQKRPSVNLILGDFEVSADDYDVSYGENVNAGEGSVTITGKGNMMGERTDTFAILPRQIDRIELSRMSDMFGETWQLPDVTVYGANDVVLDPSEYTLEWSPSAIENIGAYTATATGSGNYAGTVMEQFTLNPANLSNCEFEGIDNQWYTGREIQPKPVVIRNELAPDGVRYDRILVEGVDFYYSWSNNINVGRAYVIVTGMGNYLDTTARTFFFIVNMLGDGTWQAASEYMWDELGELTWGQIGGYEANP